MYTPEQFFVNIFRSAKAIDIIQTVLESTKNEQNGDSKLDSKFLRHEYPIEYKNKFVA